MSAPAQPATANGSWFDQPPNTASHTAHTTVPSGTSADSPISGALIGRTAITLVVIVVIILLCGWLLRRLNGFRGTVGASLPIVASRSLGQRERVVVVEIEDDWLVLGVTPQQITALDRRPRPAGRAPATSSASTAGFSGTLAKALSDRLAPRRRESKQ